MTDHEFEVWLGKHLSRFPKLDWASNIEVVDTVKEKLGQIRASFQEADQASKDLFDNPPRFADQHWPALKAQILKARHQPPRESAVPGPAVADDVEIYDPRDPSNGCPLCPQPRLFETGETLLVPTGWAKVPVHPYGLSWTVCQMFCRCPKGRERRRRQDSSGKPPEFDDLQSWPQLWDFSQSHPTWSRTPSLGVSWGRADVSWITYRSPDGRCWNAESRCEVPIPLTHKRSASFLKSIHEA